MWPLQLLNFRNSQQKRRPPNQRQPIAASQRSTVQLRLEALEDRVLMTTGAAAPPTPTMAQAAYTLFWDGVQLMDYQRTGETGIALTAHTSGGTFAIPGGQDVASLNASIAHYSPYAGPFASLFVLAGEAYEYQSLSIGLQKAESF